MRTSVRVSKGERESEDRLIPGIFKCFLGIYTWNRVQYSSQLFYTYRSIMSRHVLLSSVDPSAGQLQHEQQEQGKAASDHSLFWGGYSLDFVCLVRFLDSSVRLCSQADQTAINIIYFRLVSH